jgi:hypothetical protein
METPAEEWQITQPSACEYFCTYVDAHSQREYTKEQMGIKLNNTFLIFLQLVLIFPLPTCCVGSIYFTRFTYPTNYKSSTGVRSTVI